MSCGWLCLDVRRRDPQQHIWMWGKSPQRSSRLLLSKSKANELAKLGRITGAWNPALTASRRVHIKHRGFQRRGHELRSLGGGFEFPQIQTLGGRLCAFPGKETCRGMSESVVREELESLDICAQELHSCVPAVATRT